MFFDISLIEAIQRLKTYMHCAQNINLDGTIFNYDIIIAYCYYNLQISFSYFNKTHS